MDIMLYVGNLAKSVSANELRSLFSQAGEVTSLRLVDDDARGRSDQYGFVSMSSQHEADDAVRLFNRYLLSEQPLRVGLVRRRRMTGTPRPLIAP
jgi:cold-inducible RNA-binding protein